MQQKILSYLGQWDKHGYHRSHTTGHHLAKLQKGGKTENQLTSIVKSYNLQVIIGMVDMNKCAS